MKHLLAHTLPLLFLLASCSDEELVNGSRPKDGELTEMTFTLCIPQEEQVTTRAAAVEASTVNGLYLLVFGSGESGTLVEAHPFTEADLEDVTGTGTMVRKKFTAKLQASSEQREIYVVANANSALEKMELTVGTTTVEEVKAQTTSVTATQLAEGTPLVMSGHQTSSIPGVNLLSTDFPLIRSAAKVTVETRNREDEEEDNGEEFILSEFNLWHGRAEGSILAGCVKNLYSGERSEGATYSDFTPSGYPLYTYPCENTETDRLFVIVKGSYNGTAGYYRIDLKNDEGYLPIEPNHHYQIVIHRVKAPGYATAEDAAKHDPTGIEGTIYDIESNITNMITDGSIELGVTDKVTVHSGGSASDEQGTFYVKVYQNGKTAALLKEAIEAGTLTVTATASQKDYYWLTGIQPSTPTDGKENPEEITDNEHNQLYLLYTYTFKAAENLSGGTREGTIEVTATIDGLSLKREVTVEQTADFLGYEFVNATLDAELEGTPLTAINYWDFLLNRNDSGENTAHLYGIRPEDMGGEVRNEGFHFPVNDQMFFTYTLTLPDDPLNQYTSVKWHVEVDERFKDRLTFYIPAGEDEKIWISDDKLPHGKGMQSQSFTFTNERTSTASEGDTGNYRFGRGAFRFVLTNTETGRETVISYDLYHTGIFQYIGSDETLYAVSDVPQEGWYYYEVIPMAGRYWLDRNIGATASGYYIEGFDPGTAGWPFLEEREAPAGGLFTIASGAPENNKAKILTTELCPKGYRLPTASEFSTLTSDGSFHSEYMSASGTATYWRTYYSFATASGSSDSREHTSIYFPKNRMFYGGQTSGDAQAGYYWTQTEALGASGDEQGHWMQFMKFMGANASLGRVRTTQSGSTGEFNASQKTGMSVRCINDAGGDYDEKVYTWELYIKGYTHVFLYNKDESGNVVYLNTWPGEMITIYDTENALTMYHTFTFSSTTEYTGLHILLYQVDEHGQQHKSFNAGTNEEGNPVGFKVPASTDEGANITDGKNSKLIQSFFNEADATDRWSKDRPDS